MKLLAVMGFFLLSACGAPGDPGATALITDTLMRSDPGRAFAPDSFPTDGTATADTILQPAAPRINTSALSSGALLAFAKTLIGTPYVYGSSNPKTGFDCSGFITYVFNHFGVSVPRSSIEFTQVGTTVDTAAAQPGDIILFTGTNVLERHVGHMGIITGRENGCLQFIHSTSGKQMGVTITPFNEYYKGRFMRISRILAPGA